MKHPTVEEQLEAYVAEQPRGNRITEAKLEFIKAVRRAAAAWVGYGWMQDIIETEWNHVSGGQGWGPKTFARYQERHPAAPASPPVEPAEHIRDELEARCWSVADLAQAMRSPEPFVTALVSGDRWITSSDAVRLSEAFAVPHEFFIKLQVAYHQAQPPPVDRVASASLHIFRCPGRSARGNMARCHPEAEPGGWDVGLGMIGLNNAPYASLDDAKQFAMLVQWWLARMIQRDRDGTICESNIDAKDIAAIKESDFG